MMDYQLNDRSMGVVQWMLQHAQEYRIAPMQSESQALIIDAGVNVPGGLGAGITLARVCLSDMGDVSIAPAGEVGCPVVQVQTDHPVIACLASQYAGWQIAVGKYFAMGSGAMRAVAKREKLIQELDLPEKATTVVGVLEAGKLPGEDVIAEVASKCGMEAKQVTLVVAPTTSLAGTIQVVARSVETCLHKLHELQFDLKQVISGHGTAPLPPVAKKTAHAIGRTNDAILYGGHVTLWVQCEDEVIEQLGPKVPSSSSSDFGAPFAELFQRVGGDFYKIDPLLFSPAKVTFNNMSTGRTFTYGRTMPSLLLKSFA